MARQTAFPVKPQDELFMARALTLAKRGQALASPNPMVGAVLVRDRQIVGEGFHTYDGVRHAELIALEAAGGDARHATLYVNLEPCCHQGRTPPCTRALISAGVARVVAAMTDPNPAVSGRGFRQLRAAGVEVELAEKFQEKAWRLNEAFAMWITRRRPFVTLKSAMTLDGHLAHPKTRWITSEASRAEVQLMRHASDALLTGLGTVLADDPQLTDRTGLPRRRPLLRVVLDSRLRLGARSKLVRGACQDLLVFTLAGDGGARARALRRAGAEVVTLPAVAGGLDLKAVLRELARREIHSVLLEAGATLNQAALDLDLVDKLKFFYAPKIAGSCNSLERTRAKSAGPAKAAARAIAPLRELFGMQLEQFGPDFAVEGYLHDVCGR
jgi:diaminohydroxyphosphoribosylaminopyrimidine deaminase / 5-amino-6-(5-phosphoribosylamino)uracil reductase